MADLGGRPPSGQPIWQQGGGSLGNVGQSRPQPVATTPFSGTGSLPVLGHPATGQPSLPLPTQAPLPSVAPPMMNVNQGMTPSGQSTLPQPPPMSNVNQGMTPSGYPVQQLASALRTRRFIQ